MIQFIFQMLFYGAFLGCLAVICLWFFCGMTMHQSIQWLLNKVHATQTEFVKDTKSVTGDFSGAGKKIQYKIDDTIRKFKN